MDKKYLDIYKKSGYKDIDISREEEEKKYFPAEKTAKESKRKKNITPVIKTGNRIVIIIFILLCYLFYINYDYFYFNFKLKIEKKQYSIYKESIEKNYQEIKKDKILLKKSGKKIKCFENQLLRINKNLKVKKDFCIKK